MRTHGLYSDLVITSYSIHYTKLYDCARTSPRSYRPAIEATAALDILRQNPHRYDEHVVRALYRVVAPAVERAYELGALFASWVDMLELAPWEQAFEECGIDPHPYLEARPLDAPLPWDRLASGVSKAFLLRERERA